MVGDVEGDLEGEGGGRQIKYQDLEKLHEHGIPVDTSTINYLDSHFTLL